MILKLVKWAIWYGLKEKISYMMKKVFLDVYAGTITPKDLWILNMVKGTVLLLLVQAVVMLWTLCVGIASWEYWWNEC